LLLNTKAILHLLPDFMEEMRTPREFWVYIKATSATYAGRAQHVSEALEAANSYLILLCHIELAA